MDFSIIRFFFLIYLIHKQENILKAFKKSATSYALFTQIMPNKQAKRKGEKKPCYFKLNQVTKPMHFKPVIVL